MVFLSVKASISSFIMGKKMQHSFVDFGSKETFFLEKKTCVTMGKEKHLYFLNCFTSRKLGKAHSWPDVSYPTLHIDPRGEPAGEMFTPPAARQMHLAWAGGSEPALAAKLTDAAWRSQDVYTRNKDARQASCCPSSLKLWTSALNWKEAHASSSHCLLLLEGEVCDSTFFTFPFLWTRDFHFNQRCLWLCSNHESLFQKRPTHVSSKTFLPFYSKRSCSASREGSRGYMLRTLNIL